MKLYTVGHSNQTIEDFYELIKTFNINCLIDVRSMPYSKYTPQFNKEILSNYLKKHDILYGHFGKEFGARRLDCLSEVPFVKNDSGIITQVNFEKGVRTKDFLSGVERIKKGLDQKRNIAFMCSESDPLACHRFSFIARYFYDNGVDVQHIVREHIEGKGDLILHKDLEKIMIKDYVLHKKIGVIDQLNLFSSVYSKEQQRIDAYKLKNLDIGFCPNINEEELLID